MHTGNGGQGGNASAVGGHGGAGGLYSTAGALTVTMPATFEWDEDAHPRDERGRFGSGGDDAEKAVPTPDLPGTRLDQGPHTFNAEVLSRVGDQRIANQDYLRPGEVDWRAIAGQAKAMIATDVAARMGDKADGLVHSEMREHIGDPKWVLSNDQVNPVWREADNLGTQRYPYAQPAYFSGDDPRVLTLLREAAVSRWIHQWAASSRQPATRAVHLAAVEEFKLRPGSTASEGEVRPFYNLAGKEEVGGTRTQKEAVQSAFIYRQYEEPLRSFVRAQYEATQDYFRSIGVTAVAAWRGQAEYGYKGSEGRDTVNMRPLSAWSTSEEQAMRFASMRFAQMQSDDPRQSTTGIMLRTTIPVERILSTPVTGFGCLREQEMVVLGPTAETDVSFINHYAGRKSSYALRLALQLQPTQTLEWDEGAHPRDERGRFGEGSGGSDEPSPKLAGASLEQGSPHSLIDEAWRRVQTGSDEQRPHIGEWASRVKAVVASDLAARLGPKADALIREDLKLYVGDHDQVFIFHPDDGSVSAIGGQLGEMLLNDPRSTDERVMRGDDPRVPGLLRETAVSGWVHQWAAGSMNAEGRALQMAVAAEFGLRPSAGAGDRVAPYYTGKVAGEDLDAHTTQRANDIYARNEEPLRSFVRAQYEATQEYFKAQGITAVTVWRGQGELRDGSVRPPRAEAVADMRPISSWSASREMARSFAENVAKQLGYMHFREAVAANLMQTTFPVERILSTPLTGFGSLSEEEVVTLGPRATVSETFTWQQREPTDSEILDQLAGATFEWDESAHPRDDKGRFGEGSGGDEEPKQRYADPSSSYPAASVFAKEAYAGPIGNTGAMSRVSKVEGGPGRFKVSGVITVGKREIGTWERVFTPRSVEHELLYLKPDVRGNHIASEFNARAEAAYREAGIERITLSANLSVGGYAWAAAGYQFNWDDPNVWLAGTSLRENVDHLVGMGASREETAPLYDLADRLSRGDQTVTPQDIAAVGRENATPNTMLGVDMWVGKEAMLNMAWPGVKELRQPALVSAAAHPDALLRWIRAQPADDPHFKPNAFPLHKGATYSDYPEHHLIVNAGPHILDLTPPPITAAAHVRSEFYSDDQPRDDHGRFGEGGGSVKTEGLDNLKPEYRAELKEQLAKLPPEVAHVLNAFGIKVEARDKVTSTEKGRLDYGGMYFSGSRTVAVSNRCFEDRAAHIAQGDAHVVLHELGHAFDHAVGWVSKEPGFRALWKEAAPTGLYFQKSYGGTDPRKELFAEAAASVWSNHDPSGFTLTPSLRELVTELPKSERAADRGLTSAAWDESAHPRDDKGRFGEGSGDSEGRHVYGEPSKAEVLRATDRIPAGTTLYHATTHGDELRSAGLRPSGYGESGRGVYTTPDRAFAERMQGARSSYSPNVRAEVIEYHTDRPLNLLDRRTPDGERIYRENQNVHHGEGREAAQQDALKALGFDGVRHMSPGGDEEVVLHDPSVLKEKVSMAVRLRAQAFEWDEDAHPRDSHGRFGSGDDDAELPAITPTGNGQVMSLDDFISMVESRIPSPGSVAL